MPDISVDRRAQRALLANLRHELRTPINAIIGYSEMLMEELEEEGGDGDLVADLQKIHDSGKQLLLLVNTILDPAKLESSEFGIDISKFGEQIRVELRNPLTAAIGYCELLLEDDATAPMASDLERIRSSAERLLSTINDIVSLSQSQLQGSETGNLEALDLTLSSDTATALVEQVVTTIQALDNQKAPARVKLSGHLLLTDDNETNRDLMSRQLERQGYTVTTSESGLQTLEMLGDGAYDLILLDVIMPGMNGYTVLERIKTHPNWRYIPVIVISALDEIESVVRCIEAGAEDYLTKPFNPVLLRARIEACLEKKRLRDQESAYLAQLSNAHNEIALLNERLNAENTQLNELNAELQVQITERERAEEKYRSIFENAIDGIFQVSPEGQYLSANPALCQIYGYASPEKLMEQLVPPKLYVDSARWDALKTAIAQQESVVNFESEVRRKDKRKIWIAENCAAVRDSRGRLLYYEGIVEDITERKRTEEALKLEQEKSERLLENILPQPIATRLKQEPGTIADSFADVTVLFADIVGFTELSSRTSPIELVEILNVIFSEFDELVDRYALEKIKTIGDAYMVVGGLPTPRDDHAEAIAAAALDMQVLVAQFREETGVDISIRIGINTGPVVAGVIGLKKFIYDLWGDTVNVASRMESQGVSGNTQVTEATYRLLRDRYRFEERGAISVKGRGEMTTYLLLGHKSDVDRAS